MLELQIAQVASTSSSRALGRFSKQPEANPVEHCNALTKKSGKTLDGLRESNISGRGAFEKEENERIQTPSIKKEHTKGIQRGY